MAAGESTLTTGEVYALRGYHEKEVPEPVIARMKQLVLSSGLFDAEYYLSHNSDVKKSGMDPLDHYVKYGAYEGRDPSELFNAKYYLATNADVRELRINPLIHYLLEGKEEGRLKLPPKVELFKPSGTKRVDIINVNFYDWRGEVLYKGGAERYVFDLALIIKAMGYTPRIIQNATTPFSKVYRGVDVVGVKTNASSMRGISKAYREVCQDAELIIASPLDLACELGGLPVIGINHGIHWDTSNRHLYSHRSDEYHDIFDALNNSQAAICVDTNFVNWTRTYDYDFGKKLTYVPNYYDKNNFKPKTKDFTGKLTITYPRRLYPARGIYITLEAFDTILKNRSDVELRLVGQTDDTEVKAAVATLMNTYKGQVFQDEFAMEDMHKAYEDSHVVLIPTLFSEGTSLSCLEGMATNNAVVATNVGGLPNLIINNYNGLLIDPRADALVEAIETLVTDRSKISSMAEKGLEIAKTFEKQNWDAHWKKILTEVLQ